MADVEGPPGEHGTITELLRRVEGGDRGAYDRLFAAVYERLRALARRQKAAGPPQQTLDTTALVHETYLKLSKGEAWSLRDRHHFYATSARAMRLVLVDHARARARTKRGGGDTPFSLDEGRLPAEERTDQLVALDDALQRLESSSPELARLVEWRFFAGLSLEEIAETQQVSERTLKRRWRAARAFLHHELTQGVAT